MTTPNEILSAAEIKEALRGNPLGWHDLETIDDPAERFAIGFFFGTDEVRAAAMQVFVETLKEEMRAGQIYGGNVVPIRQDIHPTQATGPIIHSGNWRQVEEVWLKKRATLITQRMNTHQELATIESELNACDHVLEMCREARGEARTPRKLNGAAQHSTYRTTSRSGAEHWSDDDGPRAA